MRKALTVSASIIFGFFFFTIIQTSSNNDSSLKENSSTSSDLSKRDRMDLAMEQEFEMTKDPKLGIIPKERLIEAYPELQDQ